MRDSYSFQIPRHPPFNRKRKPFGYVNELSEADSQHWSLRNNIERALPDTYPSVVVWIGLIPINKNVAKWSGLLEENPTPGPRRARSGARWTRPTATIVNRNTAFQPAD